MKLVYTLLLALLLPMAASAQNSKEIEKINAALDIPYDSPKEKLTASYAKAKKLMDQLVPVGSSSKDPDLNLLRAKVYGHYVSTVPNTPVNGHIPSVAVDSVVVMSIIGYLDNVSKEDYDSQKAFPRLQYVLERNLKIVSEMAKKEDLKSLLEAFYVAQGAESVSMSMIGLGKHAIPANVYFAAAYSAMQLERFEEAFALAFQHVDEFELSEDTKHSFHYLLWYLKSKNETEDYNMVLEAAKKSFPEVKDWENLK